MSKFVFDIETGPAPDSELALVKPKFKGPSNYKDPTKIAEAIASAEADWKEKAALSAVTGRVLCIGILAGTTFEFLHGDETKLLGAFWEAWRDQGRVWVGWSCKSFDFPFLIRRSWALKVPVPADVFQGRYFDTRLVDLMDIWNCGNREQRESLDTVCKMLGLGAKNGSGADFARLWIEDNDAAMDYLRNDLRLTAALADRIGILQ